MKSKLIFKVYNRDVEIDYIKDFVGLSNSLSKKEGSITLDYLNNEGFLDVDIVNGMKRFINKNSK